MLRLSLQWLVFAGVILFSVQAFASDQKVLNTDNDKVNYGIGVTTIRHFQQEGVDLNLDLVIKGMKDALSGGPLAISEEDINTAMVAIQNELRQKQRLARRQSAVDNKKQGEAFLAANRKRDGVVTLPSGLQYEILRKGDGKRPTDADTVICNYRSSLINGTEIDNTYASGKPAVFRVGNEVIPGWREVIKLMPVGSKWRVSIPPQLAYGTEGSGMTIGPNETLIFDIELLGIK
jgi:FKBP-type peptidyl-prolyl cis-trans isomerase